MLGEHPRVRLDNEGPGWIRAEIEAPGFSLEPSELGAGSVVWAYPGPIRLVLTETGHGDTVTHLKIWGCEGLAIDGALPPAPEE